MRRLHALAVLFVLAGCGDSPTVRDWRPSDHAQTPEVANAPAPTSTPSSPEEARARAGAVLYRMQCAPCHGAAGLGDGPAAAEIAPPDLTRAEFHARASDAAIAATIRTGRGGMPAFSEIDDVGIAALVAHVRSLRRTEAVAVPAAPAQ